MKKIFVFCFVLPFCVSLYAQNPPYTDFDRMANLFNLAQYNNAVMAIDTLLTQYPKSGPLYFNRAIGYYFLNDKAAAAKDFLLAEKFGTKGKEKYLEWRNSLDLRVKYLVRHYVDYKTLDKNHGYTQVFTRKDSLQGALRPERNCYDVYFYDLTLKILPKTKSIEGSNNICFKTKQSTRRIQIDLAEKLKISSIVWKGKELKFTREYNAVFINFDEALPQGENQVVTVNYEGKPKASLTPPWDGGFVWKKNNKNWWIGVACEHLGASSWWPCKDHLSEKPDSMRINIQVPEGYMAVSNGNLRSTHSLQDHYTNFEWFVSYPINSYGVTFYMGKFVNFNEVFTNANGSYNMDYYVLQQNLDTAKKFYRQTHDIVKVYEKLYGEYPYKKDGIGMVEAPYAGMEHQSAIAIGGEYGTKKRRNYDVIGYDYLLVHETAHEWWGNTVTMGDMADAWLSESFATYSEYLFMEERYGYDAYLKVAAKGMKGIENIWPMVGPRDVNDNSFLGGDIYDKGAAMLHNLRCEINNDTLFFTMIKGFYTEYKLKISRTQDFIDFVNKATGKDFTDFFAKFLYDAEPPVLQYSYSIKNGELEFSYQWIHVGKNFTMPFGIILDRYKSTRLEGTTEKQTFKASEVKSFYIPNEMWFTKNFYEKNSFTYFWTSWLR
jgi:aminopeptidase N